MTFCHVWKLDTSVITCLCPTWEMAYHYEDLKIKFSRPPTALRIEF